MRNTVFTVFIFEKREVRACETEQDLYLTLVHCSILMRDEINTWGNNSYKMAFILSPANGSGDSNTFLKKK